jgi:hypothetical protein
VKSFRLFLPLFLALTFVGITTQAVPRAQSQAPAMDGYPAAGAPATVKLLAPGAEPRTALRYAIAAGHKANADMTMNMSMAMNAGGMSVPMDLPGMKITMSLAVTGVAPGGDITYDVAFTGLTIDTATAANPAIAAALEPMKASVTSIKGTTTMSNRGVTKSAKIDAADASIQQLMTQMTSSVENLSNPLPEEPVGAGARWEVRQAASSGGQTVFTKSTYEVVSIQGSTVTLKVATEQAAPPQSISNPGLPAGAEMYLENMSGTGQGTVVIKLDSLVPTSEMNMTSSMSMSVSLGGQNQSIVSDNKVKVTIAPAK